MNWYKLAQSYLDIGHFFYPGNELWIMELKDDILRLRSEPISEAILGHGSGFSIDEETIASGRFDAKKKNCKHGF